ncbi:hypothetical protein Dda_4997 [Drechslerella dactyloides]|uniref:Uncharacterized protein n=1 Tax=Drechslerella dactyloides TaxID=74499 RepID=A0AAD6NL54_DREDA|nr:hypothetical protein Dda_4997 [Drechslerella dactyloides]
MFAAHIFSIISLALVAAANPVPATSPAMPAKGDAWTDVTLCSYAVSQQGATEAYTTRFFLGQIVQYTTWDGWKATIYSNLAEVSDTSVWTDSYTPHCVFPSPYCFVGTWQATTQNPKPEIWIWGPHTGIGKAVKISARNPDKKEPANNNEAQSLCLNKWKVSDLPAATIRAYCVNNDYNGKLSAPCIWGSATSSYYNQPYTL